MKKWIVYDHVEKSPMYDQKSGTPENGYRDIKVLKFKTKKAAEKYKDDYLDAGNYYNRPHTVLEVQPA